MKKLLLLFILSVFALSCGTAKFTTTGDKEKKYVDDFLSLMAHGSGPDYEGLMACISPMYLKEKGLDATIYKVDNYTIWGHSIESYTTEGIVVTKVWGKDREWVHELTFKLRKEKGKLYLVPSENSDNYISPWWSRKTYIRE